MKPMIANPQLIPNVIPQAQAGGTINTNYVPNIG